MRTCERCNTQSNHVFAMQCIWTPTGWIELTHTTNPCPDCVKAITDETEAALAEARKGDAG